MSGSALIRIATLETSVIAGSEVAPSGVLTSATMPPSARRPVACSRRSRARLDWELGSWNPPACSDFDTDPPNTPDMAAKAIATTTTTHGTRLIILASLSNIYFLASFPDSRSFASLAYQSAHHP